MGYVPATEKERNAMLAFMGKNSMEDLFDFIPREVRLARPMELPQAMAEPEVMACMTALAGKNIRYQTIFRGAGAYRHFIPSAVAHLSAREEFVTAYTPYQAEMSQGVLQAIFEYQTMICELTGMDASNASVYDGASAAAEAVLMCKERNRKRVLLAGNIHPKTMAVIQTYTSAFHDMTVEMLPCVHGKTDPKVLKAAIGEDVCCFYSEIPNFYGMIEDIGLHAEIVHMCGAKYIAGVNPIALGIFKTPCECGADIAVGEGQPLGLPLSFGGPYLGFMACKQDMVRRMPGRIVGETVDVEGRRAYVLTLQAREQHIRREKASSSLCSNEALCALRASVYLSAMGPQGLAEVAAQCMSKAHYLAAELAKIGYTRPEANAEDEFFHEFVTVCPDDPFLVEKKLAQSGILSGFPLTGQCEYAGHMLWCVTELNTRAEMDEVVRLIRGGVAL